MILRHVAYGFVLVALLLAPVPSGGCGDGGQSGAADISATFDGDAAADAVSEADVADALVTAPDTAVAPSDALVTPDTATDTDTVVVADADDVVFDSAIHDVQDTPDTLAPVADTVAPVALPVHQSYIPPSGYPAAATRLIVLGDSVAEGVGATDRGTRSFASLLDHNDDAEYPDYAGVDLRHRFGAGLAFVNVAKVGGTTETIKNEQLPDLQGELAWPAAGHTVVVIHVGGNDMMNFWTFLTKEFTGNTLVNSMANLGVIVDFFQDAARFPDGTSIYLVTPYDPTDGIGVLNGCWLVVNFDFPEYVAAVEVWRQSYIGFGTQRGLAVVDSLNHFKGHGYYFDQPTNAYYDASDPSFWFYDCLHPNDRGHHELRRLIIEAIAGSPVVE